MLDKAFFPMTHQLKLMPILHSKAQMGALSMLSIPIHSSLYLYIFCLSNRASPTKNIAPPQLPLWCYSLFQGKARVALETFSNNRHNEASNNELGAR